MSALIDRVVLKRAARAILCQVYRVLAAGLAVLGFRLLQLNSPRRIGHLALEIDCFLKDIQLGSRKRVHGVLLLSRDEAPNARLLDYWSDAITVISSEKYVRYLSPLMAHGAVVESTGRYVAAINETAPYYALQKAWGDRPPLLRLREADLQRGRRQLEAIGVPHDAWFVCIHAREGGYSPYDEADHSFRDCDIATYVAAAQEIADRGGWCIRMGDKTMKPLRPQKNVVDYALSSVRSDWMDLFLCASSRFFLGNTSGLIFLATVFGTPTSQANCAPMSGTLCFGPRDVGIPKLLWSEEECRLLTFREVFDSPIANYRYTRLYQNAGLRLVDNDMEDIRDLTIEMLERTSEGARYSAEDEMLQQRFRSLFRPGHHSYGSVSRAGRAFLRKHAALLES